MAKRTSFTTLPPELRERVYEHIALTHTTHHVRTMYDESAGASEFKVTTSAITATCRLIHKEYKFLARKTITKVEFTMINADFDSIIDYFHRKVDAEFLIILQSNRATIHVNMVIDNDLKCKVDIQDFYRWALFLIEIKLEVAYWDDPALWMAIHALTDEDLAENCVIKDNSSQILRDNIEDIRDIAQTFDKARWGAYPKFFHELQVRYRREWDERVMSQEH
jgi:hypothetical protein